jgi:hypothetical protein
VSCEREFFFSSRESLIHSPAKQRGFSPFAKETRSHDTGNICNFLAALEKCHKSGNNFKKWIKL